MSVYMAAYLAIVSGSALLLAASWWWTSRRQRRARARSRAAAALRGQVEDTTLRDRVDGLRRAGER